MEVYEPRHRNEVVIWRCSNCGMKGDEEPKPPYRPKPTCPECHFPMELDIE